MKTIITLVGEERRELEILETTLKQLEDFVGYSYAGNSLDALEMIRTVRPDLVFINFNEQPLGELQLLSVIKSDHRVKRARVFLYGRSIAEETCKMAQTLGASGCIEKTNCVSTFARELRAILDPQLLPQYIFLSHTPAWYCEIVLSPHTCCQKQRSWD